MKLSGPNLEVFVAHFWDSQIVGKTNKKMMETGRKVHVDHISQHIIMEMDAIFPFNSVMLFISKSTTHIIHAFLQGQVCRSMIPKKSIKLKILFFY